MLKKPISTNKYKSVKSVVNSGKTINDVEIMSDQFLSKRKNELFKRLKGSTILKLLGENNNTESIYNLAGEQEEINFPNDNISITARQETNSVYSYKTDITAKSSVTAVTYATEMLGNLVIILKLIIYSRQI